MSTLIVEVCEVLAIDKHPSADRLSIAKVKGWNTCISFDPDTQKSVFEVGEKCVFFPPDSVLPIALAHAPDDDEPGRLGVKNYCSPVFDKISDPHKFIGYKVRAARLRGQSSFGFIMKIDPSKGDDPNWEVGTNVKEHLGVIKWEPPIESLPDDAEMPHVAFHKYTDIELYGNFPELIEDGEEVVITEKIHGTNARSGLIVDIDEDGNENWVLMAGAHNYRVKEFDDDGNRNLYWLSMTPFMRDMLEYLRDEFPWTEKKSSIIVFSEIYGSGVQDMAYGLQNGDKSFRVYDIAINGAYFDNVTKHMVCQMFGIKMVPHLYQGPFSPDLLEKHGYGVMY